MAKTPFGIRWYMPNDQGSYKRVPFMYTPQAVADRLESLADEGLTVSEAAARSVYFREDHQITQAYIEAGYGDRRLSDLFTQGTEQDKDA